MNGWTDLGQWCHTIIWKYA